MIEFYLVRLQTAKTLRKNVDINIDQYLKVHDYKMCLNTEMRTFFCGLPEKRYKVVYYDQEEDEPPVESPPRRRFGQPQPRPKTPLIEYQSILTRNFVTPETDKSKGKEFLFDNFDLVGHTAGQRGFYKNLDRLVNILIQFYRTKYPFEYNKGQIELQRKQEEEAELQRKLKRT